MYLYKFLDCKVELFVTANIKLETAGITSARLNGFNRFIKSLLVYVCNSEGPAVACERSSKRKTESAACAGYEGALVRIFWQSGGSDSIWIPAI